jgi:Putative prokaryotic signal transducing protein
MRDFDILDDFYFGENPLWDDAGEGEVVAKFFSPLEAEVAAARLRAEGIPCFLANATANTVMPHLQSIARLHVRPADVEQARVILAEAAIDTEPQPRVKDSGWILTALAVLIGLLLAALLVRAMYGWSWAARHSSTLPIRRPHQHIYHREANQLNPDQEHRKFEQKLPQSGPKRSAGQVKVVPGKASEAKRKPESQAHCQPIAPAG